MKKVLHIILTALAVLPFVACQQQEEVYTPEVKDITVVSVKNLVFLPSGGSGTITVDCASSFSATSDRNWCTVSVSGNEVTVTATENLSRESRYASILMKTSQSSQTVVVQQVGEVVSGLKLADKKVSEKGESFIYSYAANLPVQMSSDKDWVHFEMIDDEDEGTMVKVTVDPNPGLTRFATVSYGAGSLSGSAEFIQLPTPTQVTAGWDVSITDGTYDFPNQYDKVTVTPPNASVMYEFELVSKDQLKDESKVGAEAVSMALATWTEIEQGESPLDLLKTGSFTEEHENMPRSIWALIMPFDEDGIPTGEFYYKDLQVPDRGPVKKLVDGWDVAHAGGTYTDPVQTDSFTITPKEGYENVKYIATAVKKDAVADVEDFAFTNFAMSTREAILAKVAAGELASFEEGLLSGTATISVDDVVGDAVVVIVAFGDNKFYTGDYGAVEVQVPDVKPAYYNWLGEWSVPRGDKTDTWIVTVNVPEESFKVSGIAGFDADDYAVGAFVAIVPYDPATGEMVFKVYENTTVTWQDANRGTMNALLSGQYTNVQGKTYYNSGVGNTICRGKLAEDGLTAELTPRAVTSAGEPAYFYNIRWYGRYTSSSGSRSGVSWNGYETALPNTMTKK